MDEIFIKISGYDHLEKLFPKKDFISICELSSKVEDLVWEIEDLKYKINELENPNDDNSDYVRDEIWTQNQ